MLWDKDCRFSSVAMAQRKLKTGLISVSFMIIVTSNNVFNPVQTLGLIFADRADEGNAERKTLRV